MRKNNIVKRIAFIAIFSAITTILYCYVAFPLPIFPSFLNINISMIPVIIAAFMLGPWDAAVCVIIRCVVKLLLIPTSTAYVGEIADLVIGLIPAISAGLIYHYYKGKYKEALAFSSVVVLWVITGVILNVFVNIPFYLEAFFGGDMNALIGMCAPAFKAISFGSITEVTEGNFMMLYILIGIVPFNLLLSLIVVGVTAPVHKRLKVLYDMIGSKNKADALLDNEELENKQDEPVNQN